MQNQYCPPHIPQYGNLVEITGLIIIAAVETNYAPANDYASNVILYTLWDTTINQPVTGRVLNFSVVRGLAELYNTFDTTDHAGQTRVSLRSGTPDSVEVRAILDSQDSVSNYTVVSFTSPVTHTISAEPLDSYVPAGGTYRIRYTLRDTAGPVVDNALMSFTSSSPTATVSPGLGFTNTLGQIIVSITSPVALTTIISAAYAAGNAENNTAITFF
ncbi:hypothetical protein [Sodalis sp. dw_96]|uniref:Ig-like domain-containing protein n=1 Tax=Sodalis sp. dw_96 TaxID=2719794 RepID=UPI001BD3EA57|nr:hypothetical protein [Sodalis sp. dw_96]